MRTARRRYLAASDQRRAKTLCVQGTAWRDARTLFERLPLRRLLDEQGGELIDNARGPLSGPLPPSPVRFLPTWARTCSCTPGAPDVPEPVRPLPFNTRTPHSVAAFLVDGVGPGTWRHDDGHVTIELFEPPPARPRGG